MTSPDRRLRGTYASARLRGETRGLGLSHRPKQGIAEERTGTRRKQVGTGSDADATSRSRQVLVFRMNTHDARALHAGVGVELDDHEVTAHIVETLGDRSPAAGNECRNASVHERIVRVDVAVERDIHSVFGEVGEQSCRLAATCKRTVSDANGVERWNVHRNHVNAISPAGEPVGHPLVDEGVESGAGRIEQSEVDPAVSELEARAAKPVLIGRRALS